jgi:hypothetical protein
MTTAHPLRRAGRAHGRAAPVRVRRDDGSRMHAAVRCPGAVHGARRGASRRDGAGPAGQAATPTPARTDGERRPDLHDRGRKAVPPHEGADAARHGGACERRPFFKRRRNPYRLTTPARAREGGRRRELRGRRRADRGPPARKPHRRPPWKAGAGERSEPRSNAPRAARVRRGPSAATPPTARARFTAGAGDEATRPRRPRPREPLRRRHVTRAHRRRARPHRPQPRRNRRRRPSRHPTPTAPSPVHPSRSYSDRHCSTRVVRRARDPRIPANRSMSSRNLLLVAAVVDLVPLVPRAELGADRVPRSA